MSGTLCVLGLPSQTTDWVVDLCRRALGGGIEESLLNDSPSTEAFLNAEQPRIRLAISHFPGSELLSWLDAERAAVLVVAPDIYVCAAHISRIARESSSYLPTVLSLSLACLAAARRIRGHILITGRNIPAEFEAVNRTLATLNPRLRVSELAAAYKSLSASFNGTAEDGNALSALSLSDTRKTCRGLQELLWHGAPPEVEWPPAVFFDGVTRTRPARQVTDLTGPARCLYFGPNLHLPIGEWEATIAVEITNTRCPTDLRVEIHWESQRHKFPAALPGPGQYDVSIDFSVSDPLEPIQICLFIDRGEIEGLLCFRGVRLRQVLRRQRRPA